MTRLMAAVIGDKLAVLAIVGFFAWQMGVFDRVSTELAAAGQSGGWDAVVFVLKAVWEAVPSLAAYIIGYALVAVIGVAYTGTTPGLWLMGLKVVRLDGKSPVGISRAFTRYFSGSAASYAPVIGNVLRVLDYLHVLRNGSGDHRMGRDLVAGTMVVRSATGIGRSQAHKDASHSQ